MCEIEADGKGSYLGPTSGNGFETVRNGFYLMKQGGPYDGRGLILSPNSPFRNISILGMIFVIFLSEKIYYIHQKMEIDETDRHIYRIKKIDEIQEILIAKRDIRNELSTKYNRS